MKYCGYEIKGKPCGAKALYSWGDGAKDQRCSDHKMARPVKRTRAQVAADEHTARYAERKSRQPADEVLEGYDG